MKELVVQKDKLAKQLHSSTPTDKMIKRWYMLVDKYTQARLTYRSDRLVAISSLAERFQRLELGHNVLAIGQNT
jgi:hypothetical protein